MPSIATVSPLPRADDCVTALALDLFLGFEYLDDREVHREVVLVPRFANGDFLLVRRPQMQTGFALEFPRCAPALGLSSHSTSARPSRQPSTLASPAAVYLGAVATAGGATNVFAVRAPDEAVPVTSSAEAVGLPLRISAKELLHAISEGEVRCSRTLAAYALLGAHQSLQGPGNTRPLLERRAR